MSDNETSEIPKLSPTLQYNPFDEVEEAVSEEAAEQYRTKGTTEIPVKAKDEKAPVAKNEVKAGAEEDASTEESSEEEAQDEAVEESEEEVAEDVPEPTYLEFVKEDEVFKIPEDAIIKMRADGKEIKVALKDLRDHKAGAVAWDRKFTKLGEQFKEVQNQKADITAKEAKKNALLGEFEQLHSKGDTLQALEVLGELLGKEDPITFAESQLGAFSKFFERFENLSQEQIKNIFLDNRAKSLARRADLQKRRADEESTRHAAFKAYNNLKTQHSFTDDDYMVAFDSLVKAGGDPNKISMDDVVTNIQNRFLVDDIMAAEKDAGTQLTEKHRAEFFALVKQAMDNGEEVSYKDVVSMLKQLKTKRREADPKTVETLNRKIQKSPKASQKITPKKAASDQREINTWDDLADIYKL